MSTKSGKNDKLLYILVLTGGPCGGKTTGQARLSSFFENLGWKVYRVPEAANLLMSGGVKFPNLTEAEVYNFQKNLIGTMMQIEATFIDLAESCSKNCLVICDRGVMDASAYMKADQWERMKKENNWNEIELRDGRYNQVIHMVSAAKGAEAFYHIENHTSRHEGVELARHLDELTSQAWVGHPYYDVIDNSTDFDRKVIRMIDAVCNRLGIDTRDRLSFDSRKRKFLVTGIPTDYTYPQFQDFDVIHDYLVTPNNKQQARIRRRGQNGVWTYVHTIRRPEINQESPEVKTQITEREYKLLLPQRDDTRYSVVKKRRCFLWNNQYFQLDIYEEPCHARCKGLMILETYTTRTGREMNLPDFLKITREVTGDPQYSMYTLSLKDPVACNGSLVESTTKCGNGVDHSVSSSGEHVIESLPSSN